MDAQLHDFMRAPSWPAARVLMPRYAKQLPPTALRLAQKFENSLTLDKLYKALQPIAASQTPPPPPMVRVEQAKAQPPAKVRIEYALPPAASLPPDLQELRDTTIKWLREQQDIRGRLRLLAYGDADAGRELYLGAERIVRIEHNLQDAYERFDYYTRHGRRMPGTEPISKEERLLELTAKKHRNQQYLSRNRAATNPKTIAEMQRRRNELAELEKLMNEKESNRRL